MTTTQTVKPARHWPNGHKINLRFRVDTETGCHVWLGAINDSGYGIVGTNDHGNFRAHRMAYEIAHGHLADGVQLDHLCRNRACINPDHLEPVSNAENARRGAKAKLTPTDIAEIKKLRSEQGLTYRHLGKLFGVSSVAINNILHGYRWNPGV